jgi:hypothetical protein
LIEGVVSITNAKNRTRSSDPPLLFLFLFLFLRRRVSLQVHCPMHPMGGGLVGLKKKIEQEGNQFEANVGLSR